MTKSRDRSADVATGHVAPIVLAALGIGAGASVVAAVGAGTMIAARSAGVTDGSTAPALAVVAALSVALTSIEAVHLARVGRRPASAALLIVAALLSLYPALCAASAFAVALGGARGAGAELLVAVQLAWFAVPMTACQLAVIAAARREGAPRTGLVAAILVSTGAAATLIGLATVRGSGVYADLAPPLDAFDSAPAQAAFGVVSALWMGAVALPGLVAWDAIRRARGSSRHRLAFLAIAGLLPVWTIVVCLGLTAAPFWSADGVFRAPDLLAVAFAAPFPLVGAALAIAEIASDEWLRRRSPALLMSGFAIAAGGVALLAAAGVGIAIGVAGGRAAVPAVLVALAVASTLGLLSRRATASLGAWLDRPSPPPVDRRAALGTLSRREADVLGLLGRGLSNAAIAARLSLSERTIDTHVRSIFGKLGLDPDVDANRRVQAAGIWLRASTGSDETGVSTDARRRRNS